MSNGDYRAVTVRIRQEHTASEAVAARVGGAWPEAAGVGGAWPEAARVGGAWPEAARVGGAWPEAARSPGGYNVDAAALRRFSTFTASTPASSASF